MFVRTFQLSDYAAVTKLLGDALSETCFDETIGAFARQLSWDSELVLVAEKNHQVVGMLIGTVDRNNGYYYRIAIDPLHRGKGVGKMLSETLRRRFNQRKVERIMVAADQHNEPILPFYQSLGFQSTDFLHSFRSLSIVSG